MQGLQQLADEFGVVVIGGDTNSWDGGLIVSVTVVGTAMASEPITRGGAQPGDWLFVTGPLGGSIAGHHLTFTPRVNEALELLKHCTPHAMIDISDGLAADLHHILDESRVGAVLRSVDIPISEAAHQLSGDRSPLDHALSDGEDFELLFAVDAATGRRLVAMNDSSLSLFHVGAITGAAEGCKLINAEGTACPLAPQGWRHAI